MITRVPHCSVLLALALFALLVAPREVCAVQIDLERPGDREFIRDLAGLIDDADKERVRGICDKLLSERATPILVVTIESMAEHGGADLRIETFARLLFDQWEIGHAKLGDQLWNTGILLLVSKNDRRARIELGAGWGREKDPLCDQIMSQHIVSHFKRGEFSQGIVAGVEALDQMAREKPLPKVAAPPRPWWHYALIVGFIGLAIFTVVSLIRRGGSGWAWLFWGVVFSAVGYMLYNALTRSSRGGGSFGGGSFGGGFSGGGGATGSW